MHNCLLVTNLIFEKVTERQEKGEAVSNKN